jgi:hypothetical protein
MGVADPKSVTLEAVAGSICVDAMTDTISDPRHGKNRLGLKFLHVALCPTGMQLVPATTWPHVTSCSAG